MLRDYGAIEVERETDLDSRLKEVMRAGQSTHNEAAERTVKESVVSLKEQYRNTEKDPEIFVTLKRHIESMPDDKEARHVLIEGDTSKEIVYNVKASALKTLERLIDRSEGDSPFKGQDNTSLKEALQLIMLAAQDKTSKYESTDPDITDQVVKDRIESVIIHMAEAANEYQSSSAACMPGTFNKLVESLNRRCRGVKVDLLDIREFQQEFSKENLAVCLPFALWEVANNPNTPEFVKSYLQTDWEEKKLGTNPQEWSEAERRAVGSAKKWLRENAAKLFHEIPELKPEHYVMLEEALPKTVYSKYFDPASYLFETLQPSEQARKALESIVETVSQGQGAGTKEEVIKGMWEASMLGKLYDFNSDNPVVQEAKSSLEAFVDQKVMEAKRARQNKIIDEKIEVSVNGLPKDHIFYDYLKQEITPTEGASVVIRQSTVIEEIRKGLDLSGMSKMDELSIQQHIRCPLSE